MVTQTSRTCEEKKVFFLNKSKFDAAVDLNKCLKQIKLIITLYICAPISELPYCISTMM